jgi:hypothetical protein
MDAFNCTTGTVTNKEINTFNIIANAKEEPKAHQAPLRSRTVNDFNNAHHQSQDRYPDVRSSC